MKRIILIYVLVFIASFYCNAQITFQKTYGGAQGDGFSSVQQTFDGGYIMVGYTNSFGAGGYDVYLVKTDMIGDTLWTRTYGGAGNDVGNCVQQTTDSGYIITGSTTSFGPGYDRIYLIKTDASGDTLWTKTYDPINQYGQYGGIGSCVKQTLDGGYILGCAGDGYGVEFLIKTDAVGDTLWTKCYGIEGGTSEIQQTADSGYIVTGTGDNGDLFYYMYLVKTDINGNAIWKKTYGGNSYGEYGYSVKQTIDGGYISVGYINNSQADVYLVKTNSIGDTLWTKTYGGDSVDSGHSIYLTSDSGYIIAGGTNSYGAGGEDVYLIKIDSIGDILWTKSFGGVGGDACYSVQQTSDEGFILAGYTKSFGAGSYDGYLIKTDANGNSGCYESGTTTFLRTPPTIVSNPVDTFLLGAIDVNSYSSLVGSGGIINLLCFATGINELIGRNAINIYPNPSQDNFIIYLNAELFNANLEIRNVLGEKNYATKLNSNYESISCNEFPSGIYLITIRKDNEVITKKLIINK